MSGPNLTNCPVSYKMPTGCSHKGNIPGIPDEMDARLEEAEEQIYIVTQSLQEVPLNMKLVELLFRKCGASQSMM